MAMSTSQSQDPSRVQDAARTPKQWGQLLFFYFCFYGWLIAFFAICYSVMFSTLPDRRSPPKLDNLINPGFMATYGISFTDFKNQHMRFLPATITPPVPFTNNPGVYKDSVAAVQFNFTSFQQDIIDGTLEFDFRIGIQFDYGQNKLQSVGRGYQILDVNVRQ
ncbi:hypothetical protein PTSG_05902 [Salpingoeca rosetta]|uniref:Uncharacterized protein n=1 Tax=Salpingoeca rosetta (strain ATCC 50818 / BSB-021) TaxID=946362 RepID=F2UD43_SALR5|nr:uncharacterized protein PTSG_05902 [Salpingoeca rosetta]EGD74538.1 hypothetical protein PTSG_05902 [Salpingoeca rosetta]|eukprot:XP_004992795.1 hypothetical protein PTSG_05902 [Salpingoeca rosetta]